MGVTLSAFERVEHCWTITPLTGGGVYPSAWQRVSLYPRYPTDVRVPVYHDRARIIGLVYSDQSGSLIVQGSLDAVNVHWASAAMAYVGLSTAGDFDVVIPSLYVRLVYTNGAVGQAVFGLFGWLAGVAQ